MNRSSKLRVVGAVMSVAFASSIALTAGCSSMAGDIEMAPTTYIAVAPLDLPDDYAVPSDTVYYPVAPLDLPNDYGTTNFGSDDGDDIVAAANGWMAP